MSRSTLASRRGKVTCVADRVRSATPRIRWSALQAPFPSFFPHSSLPLLRVSLLGVSWSNDLTPIWKISSKVLCVFYFALISQAFTDFQRKSFRGHFYKPWRKGLTMGPFSSAWSSHPSSSLNRGTQVDERDLHVTVENSIQGVLSSLHSSGWGCCCCWWWWWLSIYL